MLIKALNVMFKQDMIDLQGLLLATNLGSADYTQSARHGGTGCEVTSWRSDSTVTCLVATGVGGGPACAGAVEEPLLGHCGQNMMVTIIDSLVRNVSCRSSRVTISNVRSASNTCYAAGAERVARLQV